MLYGGKYADKMSQGGKTFKKKSPKSSYTDKKREGVLELLRGLNFSIKKDGPDNYLKAVNRFGLCVQFVKDWSGCAEVPTRGTCHA